MQELSSYKNSIVPFFGVVEEVIDESYVRVRCFGTHPLDKEAVPTDALPPALVLYPTSGGQVGGGSISHNVEVDSWVMGYFVDHPFCMQPIVTHVVQGTDYSMSTYKSQGGQFVGQGATVTDDGTDGSEIDPDSQPTINIPGNSNVQKSYNYIYHKLKSEGSSADPHLHASAMVGVLMLETSGINPAVVGGYKGRAWGICQWLGTRRSQLFSKYGKTKRLDQQLDFMWWEFNNTEKRAKGLWLKSTNMVDAVAGAAAFERAEEYQNGRIYRGHPNFKKRLKYAYQVHKSTKFTGESMG